MPTIHDCRDALHARAPPASDVLRGWSLLERHSPESSHAKVDRGLSISLVFETNTVSENTLPLNARRGSEEYHATEFANGVVRRPLGAGRRSGTLSTYDRDVLPRADETYRMSQRSYQQRAAVYPHGSRRSGRCSSDGSISGRARHRLAGRPRAFGFALARKANADAHESRHAACRRGNAGNHHQGDRQRLRARQGHRQARRADEAHLPAHQQDDLPPRS